MKIENTISKYKERLNACKASISLYLENLNIDMTVEDFLLLDTITEMNYNIESKTYRVLATTKYIDYSKKDDNKNNPEAKKRINIFYASAKKLDSMVNDDVIALMKSIMMLLANYKLYHSVIVDIETYLTINFAEIVSRNNLKFYNETLFEDIEESSDYKKLNSFINELDKKKKINIITRDRRLSNI